MPIISRFYGIIIKMYFQQSEHNPPHFHAIYGEYVGAFDIKTLEMIKGDLPTKGQAWLENGQQGTKINCLKSGIHRNL